MTQSSKYGQSGRSSSMPALPTAFSDTLSFSKETGSDHVNSGTQPYQRLKSRPLPSSVRSWIGPAYRSAIEDRYKEPQTSMDLKKTDETVRKQFKQFMTHDEIGWSQDRRDQLYALCDNLHAQAEGRLADKGKQVIRLKDVQASIAIPSRFQVESAFEAKAWATTCLDALLPTQTPRQADSQYVGLMSRIRKTPLAKQASAVSMLDSARKLAAILHKAKAETPKITTEVKLRAMLEGIESGGATHMHSGQPIIFKEKWAKAWTTMVDQAIASVQKIRDKRHEEVLRTCQNAFARVRTMKALDSAYTTIFPQLHKWHVEFPYSASPDVYGIYERTATRIAQSNSKADKANAVLWSRKALEGWKTRCTAALGPVREISMLICERILLEELQGIQNRFPMQGFMTHQGTAWLKQEKQRVTSYSDFNCAPQAPFEAVTAIGGTKRAASLNRLTEAMERCISVSPEALRGQANLLRAGLDLFPLARQQQERRQLPTRAFEVEIGPIPGLGEWAVDEGPRGRSSGRERDKVDAKLRAPLV